MGNYFDPASNQGNNFWSSQAGQVLGKVQQVTDPIYEASKRIFPSGIVTKSVESYKSGIPISYSPEEIENMAMGMMGNLSAVKSPNLFGNLAKQVDPGVVDEMAAFTDYVADVKNKVIKPNYKYEADVRDMITKLGLNPNKTNRKMVEDFTKVLQEGDSLYNKTPMATQPKGVGGVANNQSRINQISQDLSSGKRVNQENRTWFGNQMKQREMDANSLMNEMTSSAKNIQNADKRTNLQLEARGLIDKVTQYYKLLDDTPSLKNRLRPTISEELKKLAGTESSPISSPSQPVVPEGGVNRSIVHPFE